MIRSIAIICAIAVTVVSAGFPRIAVAQDIDANCSYERCALGLAPTWNGLAVTRGESQRHVATLDFFFPTDITRAFDGSRPAIDAATDALNVRRAAAALTDAGIILIGTGIARAAFQKDFDRLSQVLTLTGGLSLGASVPFQFAADGLLSRAVWLYNRRYSK